MLKQIASVQEFEEVIRQDRVLVEFFQPWCPYCKAFFPVLEEYAASPDSLPCYQVSGEEFPNLFEAYDVESYPTVYIFENGAPAAKETGAMEMDQLLAFTAR